MKVNVSKTTAIQAAIAIFFAFVLFFIAESKDFRQNSAFSTSYTSSQTTIENVKINFNYDNEKYDVDSKIETANVTVTSDNKVLLEKAKNGLEISVDLREKESGMQYQFYLSDYVKLSDVATNVNIQNISFATDPTTITVGLIEVEKKIFPIEVEGYEEHYDPSVGQPQIIPSNSEIEIKGAITDIDRIERVVAIVSPDEFIDSEYEGDAILYAIDSEGSVIDNLEFEEESISVKISMSSANKEVPIKVTVENNDNVKSSVKQETVTITGPQEELDEISEVPVTVDASDIKEDQTVTEKLELDNKDITLSENEVEVDLKVNSK